MDPIVDSSVPQEVLQTSEPAQQTPFYKNKKLLMGGAVGLCAVVILVGAFIFAQKPKPKTYTITEKNSDSVLHVKKNDTVRIESKTFPDLKITTEIQNPSVIQPASATHFQNGNYTGLFKADKPGETDVFVMGKPDCTPGKVCTPLVLNVYKVHIIVDK